MGSFGGAGDLCIEGLGLEEQRLQAGVLQEASRGAARSWWSLRTKSRGLDQTLERQEAGVGLDTAVQPGLAP